MALRWHDLALTIDEIVEKFQAIKILHKEEYKENLRMEFEYDEVGKPIFYVVYDQEESDLDRKRRIEFEGQFSDLLKRSFERT